jgi:protein phosphatase PTC2/3
MSRALGDFPYKLANTKAPEEQAVTALPEVTTHEISEEDEFLILACDGSCWYTLLFPRAVELMQLFCIVYVG